MLPHPPGYASFAKRTLTISKNKRPASFNLAGRPVDCLGLTKRWSLYVASHGNSRVLGPNDERVALVEALRDQRKNFIPTHRLVCGL
jgi:hypothetical protein